MFAAEQEERLVRGCGFAAVAAGLFARGSRSVGARARGRGGRRALFARRRRRRLCLLSFAFAARGNCRGGRGRRRGLGRLLCACALLLLSHLEHELRVQRARNVERVMAAGHAALETHAQFHAAERAA